MSEDVSDLAEADPRRPYKLYVAVVSAFLTSLVTQPIELPSWLRALMVAVIAGGAVYMMPNPIKRKSPIVRDDEALF